MPISAKTMNFALVKTFTRITLKLSKNILDIINL